LNKIRLIICYIYTFLDNKSKIIKRKEILKKLYKLVPFEKVETGFYVYQGIWIPKIAGRRLAETWGLGKVVEPLLKSD
jgi:hypothetical protein